MPDVPRVGDTFVLAALLVVPPGMESQAQEYTLIANGEPQLSYQTTPLLSGLQAFGALDGFPELLVFEAVEAGSTQVQVRVSVKGADGTVGEVLSPVLAVTVQE